MLILQASLQVSSDAREAGSVDLSSVLHHWCPYCSNTRHTVHARGMSELESS